MTPASYLQRCEARLLDLKHNNQLRTAAIVDVRPNGQCTIDDQTLVNFGGNDYLSLAHELGSQNFAVEQLGSTASAAVAGRSTHHARLELKLAEFEDTEAALLFPSGFAANLGVLGALVEEGDAVFCDRDNHASIIDAARSCAGKLLVYRRDKLQAFERALGTRRPSFNRVFIVTDGVFSMDGEVAPLQQLCDIAEHHDAAVIVDEAHGTGVLGHHGRGACDYANVEDRVLLRIGTLSKALGGLGGFVVSHSCVIELLRNLARTQFFSTALPPAMCQAMLRAIDIMQTEPERRERLATLTQFAHHQCAAMGLSIVGNGTAPIIPILIGDDAKAVLVSKQLRHAGFFIPAIRPPTVPAGTARLRMSLTTSHSQNQIEQAVTAIVAALDC